MKLLKNEVIGHLERMLAGFKSGDTLEGSIQFVCDIYN